MWDELKVFVAVVAVAVCFIGGFLYLKMVFKAPPSNVVPTLYVEHEDDPGWDCNTMGNKVCGL